MKSIYLHFALFFSIILTSCTNHVSVCVNGTSEHHPDGTPIELYYLQNDSVITVANDSLVHSKFNFIIDANPNIAYYISVNDSQNPSRGMFFAEKGTVNIAFDSTYHVSGTPMNDLYNTYLTETRRIEKLGEMEYHRSIEGKDNPDTSVFDSLLQVFTNYKVKFQLDNIHNIVGKTTFIRKQKELDAKIGTKIKDMEFPDASGVKRKLSSFIPKNGYLYIDLWSSGCAPCIAEFPELEKTYSQYKDKGLNVLLISIDKNMEDFQSALKKHQIKFTSLIDTTEGEKVKENFPFSGIPHGILINSNGEIVANQLHNILLKKKLMDLVNE